MGGWDYGDFGESTLQFIDDTTDLERQCPGPKMINTLAANIPQLQNTPDPWHEPWLLASDPIIPHVTWMTNWSAEQQRHSIR